MPQILVFNFDFNPTVSPFIQIMIFTSQSIIGKALVKIHGHFCSGPNRLVYGFYDFNAVLGFLFLKY